MTDFHYEWNGTDVKNVCSATRDDVRVDIENLNEGYCGDYKPDDPEDQNLLRFTVYVREDGETPESVPIGDRYWQQVDDASYCTRIRAEANKEQILCTLSILLDEFYSVLHNQHDCSVKRLGEHLSWIDADNVTVAPENMTGLYPDQKVRDARIRELWEEFGDIPMDPETECMEGPFLDFRVGTNRMEIWHWFDMCYSKGISALLYGEADDKEFDEPDAELTKERLIEIIDGALGWVLSTGVLRSEEERARVLKDAFGMSKEELHEFCIESLDDLL